MSRSVKLSMIQEHGSRQQYSAACIYAARGNDQAIDSIYRKVTGNV